MGRTQPYTLMLTSHKGGTGRTTCALGLAWVWGRMGLNVALVDADPSGAARLIAAGATGECPWDNVVLEPNVHRAAGRGDRDVVLLDGPPLTDPAAARALESADGVILTAQAELMTLRTLPLAAGVLQDAGRRRPGLEFLGVSLLRFRDGGPHGRIKRELQRLEGDLLLTPDVPDDPAVTRWPLAPGSDLPDGPARDAYHRLAEAVGSRLCLPSLA